MPRVSATLQGILDQMKVDLQSTYPDTQAIYVDIVDHPSPNLPYWIINVRPVPMSFDEGTVTGLQQNFSFELIRVFNPTPGLDPSLDPVVAKAQEFDKLVDVFEASASYAGVAQDPYLSGFNPSKLTEDEEPSDTWSATLVMFTLAYWGQ